MITRKQKKKLLLKLKLSLDSPTSTPSTAPIAKANNADDVFSNFLSAPPASASPRHDTNQSQSPSKQDESNDSAANRRSAEEESFFNQPAPAAEKKQLSKDSILALYGSSNQQPTMFTNPGMVVKLIPKKIVIIYMYSIFRVISTTNQYIPTSKYLSKWY